MDQISSSKKQTTIVMKNQKRYKKYSGESDLKSQVLQLNENQDVISSVEDQKNQKGNLQQDKSAIGRFPTKINNRGRLFKPNQTKYNDHDVRSVKTLLRIGITLINNGSKQTGLKRSLKEQKNTLNSKRKKRTETQSKEEV